ncbi:HPr kinase/phosphatase C-terminal domain-containing protein [Sedimentitalea sp. JM2-8]|uniref:HPr kinase/phosphatase C-terminal domain-containing protein n=1 Tax=Sedimentitalea xiamensis TaxID=3050037 RepID=A0ABT7FB86_9RHOB|nr:HPr kinase/phosphatase C-terminal domain-containing protein [Sedimentitalea xiamensis]MDK3072104.1 HPr kinase/phosphatase C-terminal domain-containing protein [Sedimentitalea xiamensis]
MELNGNGLLVLGASGSGKSTLALSLLAFNATLVADDRVILEQDAGAVIASSPPILRGLIEARGVGLLTCTPGDPVPVKLVVDMDQAETERLPQSRTISLLGQDLPLLYRVAGPQFVPGLVQFLKSGRFAP